MIQPRELLAIFAIRQWRIDRTKVVSGSIGCYRVGGWQERRQSQFDARIVRVIDFERVLHTLPADEQEVLILRYGEGRNHEEISLLIGACQRTIHNRIALGRRRLTAELEKRGLI